MAGAEANQDPWDYLKGTAEEEEAKTKVLELPEEFFGTWTQRKENGIENFDEFLTEQGMNMIKRGLIKAVAMNNFQFILSKKNDKGEAVENGVYFEATKPKSVKCEIKLGLEMQKVKLPKGEVEMRSYVIDNKFVCETWFPKASSYEIMTRTIGDDGVMKHFVQGTKKKKIDACKEEGKDVVMSTHTRWLVKEKKKNVEK